MIRRYALERKISLFFSTNKAFPKEHKAVFVPSARLIGRKIDIRNCVP
jgi:hypothetical protein